MALTLTSPPSVEPITLTEAKAHLRIDASDEDAWITRSIKSVRRQCEGAIFSALITQTWEQTLDAFPSESIKLMKPPVLAISSVTYVDANGDTQTLAADQYVLDNRTPPGYLLPADGTTWPATDDVINAVTITFTAGFGPATSDVPEDLISWMLMALSFLYENRSTMDASGRARELPSRFVDGLLDPYRQYGL